MMDLEGFGMGSMDPRDYAGEIAIAKDGVLESIDRRDTQVRWAKDDLTRALVKGEDMEKVVASMAFLTTVAKVEEEHRERIADATRTMTARMVLDMVEAGKMDVPEEVQAIMRELLGEPQEIDSESASATIEGIGNFDDLPVAEPERPKDSDL